MVGGVQAPGRPLHNRTVKRWIGQGVKAADGTRVKLAFARVGLRLFTSRAAIRAFVARLGRAAFGRAPDRPHGRCRPSVRHRLPSLTRTGAAG